MRVVAVRPVTERTGEEEMKRKSGAVRCEKKTILRVRAFMGAAIGRGHRAEPPLASIGIPRG